MRADLHTHTTASDGELNPVELVDLAAQRGIYLLAITDHDTTAGIAPAKAAGNRFGVRIIAAIELSTYVDSGELHILGYGIDPSSPELQQELSLQRSARLHRAAEMVNRLHQLGYSLPEDIAKPLDEDSSIGRPHIARALVSIGAVSSVDEAFKQFLVPGKPAFVPKRNLTPNQAIELISVAGGVPVFAHQLSCPDFAERLNDLIAAGLTGLEVYYGEYSTIQRQHLLEISNQAALLPTGGSDFHGEGFREGRELGSVCIPEFVIDRFLRVTGMV